MSPQANQTASGTGLDGAVKAAVDREPSTYSSHPLGGPPIELQEPAKPLLPDDPAILPASTRPFA